MLNQSQIRNMIKYHDGKFIYSEVEITFVLSRCFFYWPALLPEAPLPEVRQPEPDPDPEPEPEPEPHPEPMEPEVADPVPEWESSCSCSKMSSRSQDEELPSLWAPSPADSLHDTWNTR